MKANAGTAGVDKESLEDFERNLKDNLYKLWNRMTSGSYMPPPVKGVAIPKKSGGQRMLGVPCVADRVAQTVVKLTFEPIVEKVFLPDSYGYRPNKSAHDAIAIMLFPTLFCSYILELNCIENFQLRPWDSVPNPGIYRISSPKREKAAMTAAIPIFSFL